MFLDCNVRILGTPWRVIIGAVEIDKRLAECDGFCDKTSKLIAVEDCRNTSNLDNPMLYVRKVVRHEVIHAFMHESGLDECTMHKEYGQEEQMVDWFAYQYPKIKEVIETLDELITEAIDKELEIRECDEQHRDHQDGNRFDDPQIESHVSQNKDMAE